VIGIAALIVMIVRWRNAPAIEKSGAVTASTAARA
jgi:hypothetical protein